VIGREPFLEASLAADGTQGLTLYGHPGTTYVIEYTTDIAADVWHRLPGRILLNSVSSPVRDLPQNLPKVFYRAAEYDGEPPALEGALDPDGTPRLILFGKPGTVYLLQYATSLSSTIEWVTLQSVTLTNSYQPLKVSGPASGALFFRLIDARLTGPTLRAVVNADNTGHHCECGGRKTYTWSRASKWPHGCLAAFKRFTPTNSTQRISSPCAGRVFYRLKQD